MLRVAFMAFPLILALTHDAPGQTLFSDDFNDGNANGWIEYDGAFSVEDGEYVIKSTGYANDARAVAGNSSWSDISIDVDFFMDSTSSSTHAAVLFRVLEIASGTDAGKYYQAYVFPGQVGICLMDYSGGNCTSLKTESFSTSLQEWHHMRLTVVGSQVDVYIDGQKALTYGGLTHYEAGRIGLKAINSKTIRYDNVVVQSLSSGGGGGPDLWVDIIGLPSILVGTPQKVHVSLGNQGDVDAHDLLLWITAPDNVTLEVTSDHPEDDNIEWDVAPTVLEIDDGIAVPLWMLRVPAESTFALPLTVTVVSGVLGNSVPLKAELTAYDSLFAQTGDVDEVGTSPIFQTIAESMHQSLADGGLAFSQAEVSGGLTQVAQTWWQFAGPGTVVGVGVGSVMVFGFGLAPAWLVGATLVGQYADNAALIFKFLKKTHLDAIAYMERETAFLDPTIVGSIDPNDKVGPTGTGTERWVQGDLPLTYAVFFENLPAATAPAQRVVIEDDLDGSLLDLSTLSLGPFSFGNHVIVPPLGVQSHITVVDLRPDMDLLVEITANLDLDMSRLTWRFQSIDPATGEPPADPLSGFLPPNLTPPEGDGSVIFTVSPLSTAPTYSQIRNDASIVFDANEAILTPEWQNTVDRDLPVSEVSPLPAESNCPAFEVAWSGLDDGSGIAGYSVYVSEDGAPFMPFLPDTTWTSAVFQGAPGHNYAFYSVAVDAAGNAEAAPPTADAATAVADLPVADDVSIKGSWDVQGSILIAIDEAKFVEIPIDALMEVKSGKKVCFPGLEKPSGTWKKMGKKKGPFFRLKMKKKFLAALAGPHAPQGIAFKPKKLRFDVTEIGTGPPGDCISGEIHGAIKIKSDDGPSVKVSVTGAFLGLRTP